MSALQGYNATILAYGPTGTGKTYTMGGLKALLMEAHNHTVNHENRIAYLLAIDVCIWDYVRYYLDIGELE